MSQQLRCSKNDIIRTLTLWAPVGQFLLPVKFPSEYFATGEVFKQEDQKINTLSLLRPLLLSGNFQSERVAAGVRIQTTILSEF